VSPPLPPPAAAPAGAWPMIRAMVGIGLVCGVAIVLAYRGTLPVIERNRAEALQKAILQVLPAATSSAAFVLGEDGGFAPLAGKPGAVRVIHAGYDGEGRLVGFAIEAAGMGYQDTIRVLYGYDPVRQAIVGFRVLESRETPGLGDKIDTDPVFLENFRALDVTLAADGAALAHPITSVASGKKTSPWEVDAITGATVSSKAVAKLLQESAAFWMPKIRPRLDDFAKGGRP
jgi:electron transport complex protein RnfG